MSEMVERVTRAIFEADGGTWPITDPTFRDLFGAYARAAIAAMREPTEAMVKAAYTVDRYDPPEDVWGPMIDSALSGECPEYDQAMKHRKQWLVEDGVIKTYWDDGTAGAEAPAE